MTFKSKMTKIYYCWPPILDHIYSKRTYVFRISSQPILDPIYSKKTSVVRISSQYYCVTSVTIPGKLILLPVRDNLSSQVFQYKSGKIGFFQRSHREVIYFCIFTEVKHIPSAGYCFQKLNDQQK